MKKITTSFGTHFVLLALAFSMYACGFNRDNGQKSNNGRSDGGPGLPKQTTISYEINLDDSKISKEEGNKVFYNVPVGTEVVITATTQGPEKVGVAWNVSYKRGNFPSLPPPKATTWQLKPTSAGLIEVAGFPMKTTEINGVPLIVNEKKTFVIEWERCLKVDIDSVSLADYREGEAKNFAQIDFFVHLQNLQDQPIELKKLDLEVIDDIKGTDFRKTTMGINSDTTLTKNDTYSASASLELVDIGKSGKDIFMQFLKENFLSITLTVKDKEGNELGVGRWHNNLASSP